jgi:MOSC domain-containing protein YiiM
LGDIVRIGTAVLQVTEPRQPCFKFALRFDDVAMPRAMVRNGYCGWYYRVLTPGSLAAGDSVVLEERPNPDWSIDRVNRLIVQRRATEAERAAFAQLPGRPGNP